GERPKFLLEEVERRGIEVQQRLERNPLAALPVEGPVNNTHAAPSKAADDLVADRANPVSWLRDHPSIQRTRSGAGSVSSRSEYTEAQRAHSATEVPCKSERSARACPPPEDL